jgi:hypothetical protein
MQLIYYKYQYLVLLQIFDNWYFVDLMKSYIPFLKFNILEHTVPLFRVFGWSSATYKLLGLIIK